MGLEVRVGNNPQHPTHSDPLHSGLTKFRRTVLIARDQVFRHKGVYAVCVCGGGHFRSKDCRNYLVLWLP